MPDEIPWVIPQQTIIKHDLLKHYISPWMNILFHNQERYGMQELLIYLDGFSGPGIYYTDETKTTTCNGSPLIVAETANKYIEQKNSRKVIIYCIDSNEKCVESIKGKLNNINKYKQEWKIYQADFKTALPDILAEIEKKGLTNYPIFFFIDPFGYTGYPMKVLKELIKLPMSEVFINFMIYDIVRFCEANEKQMKELYDCEDFKNISQYTSPFQKQQFLINLYCKQLKEKTDAKYFMQFKVNTPDRGTRPRYYLIHISKNIIALKLMKDNMAKESDIPYRFEAIGINTKQEELFKSPEEYTLEETIKGYLQNNKNISYELLEDWSYVNTSGISKTIKKCLMALEEDGIIKIERKPRQKINTVTKGAKIIYETKTG